MVRSNMDHLPSDFSCIFKMAVGLALLPAAWNPELASLDEGGWLSQEWSQRRSQPALKETLHRNHSYSARTVGIGQGEACSPKYCLESSSSIPSTSEQKSTFCFR